MQPWPITRPGTGDEDGADVLAAGHRFGDKNHAIVARIGDRSAVATIGTGISSTGVLEIIGGVLFPFRCSA